MPIKIAFTGVFGNVTKKIGRQLAEKNYLAASN
jgi:hypothetical protein